MGLFRPKDTQLNVDNASTVQDAHPDAWSVDDTSELLRDGCKH